MRESEYQKHIIDIIKMKFPKAIILKNDPDYKQGIPDLTIFNNKNWAALEVKKSEKENRQVNQEYYVNKMNGMSFASFIYPENEEKVLGDLFEHLNKR